MSYGMRVMEITRRDFLKSLLVLGSTLIFSPVSLQGYEKKEEPWRPAYETLEKVGKLADYLNIMAQYHVDYRTYKYPRIARGITEEEFLEAVDWAEKQGLSNLDPKTVAVRDFYLKR